MQWKNFLRYAIIGGIFCLPFIPLIVAKSMFFPFITGKAFTFRVIVEIIFFLWLILAWHDVDYRPKMGAILWVVLGFLGVVTLADILGEDPFRSFWSNFERMEGLVTLVHLSAYFLVASSVMRSRKNWGALVHVSLGVAVLAAFYSLVQLSGKAVINQGGARVDATFGNATYFAVYMMLHIFLAAWLFVRERLEPWMRWTYGALAFLFAFVMFQAATRGALLGLIGGGLIATFIIALFGKEYPVARKASVGALGVLLLIVVSFFAVRNAEFIKNDPILGRIANISLEEGASRFMVWSMAWEGFKEKPILGWGQENFILIFNKNYNPGMYNQESWFDHAHNTVFDWLTAAGFLGLLAYLAIFGTLLYTFWRGAASERFTLPEKAVLSGLLAGYFFQNLFVFDNITSYLLFFSILAFVHGELALGLDRGKKKESFAFFENNAARNIGAPILVVVLVFAVYFLNARGIIVNKQLLQGMNSNELSQATTQKGRDDALAGDYANFERALSYKTVGWHETREQLAQSAARIAGMPVGDEAKRAWLVLAKKETDALIAETPPNARNSLFMATLLGSFRQNDEALRYLEDAKKISPKKQDIYYLITNTHLNTGEYKKALESAKVAFEADERNSQARKIYGAVAIYAGEDALAKKILTPTFGTTLIPEPIFINAYVARGNFRAAAELWQKRVDQDSKNAQFRISLAAAHVELGQYQKAIDEIQKAMALEPQLKEQGEYYIKTLKEGKKP